jgi:hypothetical protein
MSKLDDAIHDALSKEDAEFLARFERDPNLAAQLHGLFRGPMAWVNVLFMAGVVLAGILAVFAGWKFANAIELRPLMHWGALAAFGLLVVSIVRIVFFVQMAANRIVLELKRLELQVARLAARQTD